MKNTKVRYKQYGWDDEFIGAVVLSEPYPVIRSIDHRTKNGNIYSGSVSSTHVLINVNGAIVEVEVSRLELVT